MRTKSTGTEEHTTQYCQKITVLHYKLLKNLPKIHFALFFFKFYQLSKTNTLKIGCYKFQKHLSFEKVLL